MLFNQPTRKTGMDHYKSDTLTVKLVSTFIITACILILVTWVKYTDNSSPPPVFREESRLERHP